MIALILLLIVIALMFAMYISKKIENRKTERFDRLKEKQRELFKSLKQTGSTTSKIQNARVSDTTGDAAKNKSW